MMTVEAGTISSGILDSVNSGVESQCVSTEFEPARNQQAGHEPSEWQGVRGAPRATGQSSL
jgi:hypothetical protein